jgi:inosine-uridine nucleoside N-ribohydrolase
MVTQSSTIPRATILPPIMKRPRFTLLLAALVALLPRPSMAAAAPVKVIFDTDMASDVDDVGALAILHALADLGEAEILAVGISSRNEDVGPCLDAINTWYGRPDIPIGYQRGIQVGYPTDSGEPTESKYAAAVGKAFPHDLAKSSDAPEAALLYRKVLAAQADGSVVIVSVGFLTNLRSLLDTPADSVSPLTGEELVRRKVRLWVCMGGKFPDGRFSNGDGEYNLRVDTEASVRALSDWPTPVVFSGFEIGTRVMTGKRLGAAPEASPVRAAYLHFNGLNSRESWDQTAVLYAVRGAAAYWTESETGLCLMHVHGRSGYNEWLPTPRKSHRYLIEKMAPAEVGRVIEDLMTRPPVSPPRP